LISGATTLIAHLGYPIEGFKAPLIYNPWFESQGIDAAVVPMGVRAEDYVATFASLFRVTNLRGALITMPHKITTVALLDSSSPAVQVAGACNAVIRRPQGSLHGDLFDGQGFVQGLRRKSFVFEGAVCLVVGCGGVGSAIAASLAKAGVASISLFDTAASAAEALADRLRAHFPALHVRTGSTDPAGHTLVVNATPVGSLPSDGLPLDFTRLAAGMFVADVTLGQDITPLLRAARSAGCAIQPGIDMLFEQIPLYLEFFGFGTAIPEELRTVSGLAPTA
jgi:shikimate dehydrogenase